MCIKRVDPKTIDTLENTIKKKKSIKYLFGKCGHVKNNNKFLSTVFSPAYRRTLETKVSVTDVMMMMMDLTH